MIITFFHCKYLGNICCREQCPLFNILESYRTGYRVGSIWYTNYLWIIIKMLMYKCCWYNRNDWFIDQLLVRLALKWFILVSMLCQLIGCLRILQNIPLLIIAESIKMLIFEHGIPPSICGLLLLPPISTHDNIIILNNDAFSWFYQAEILSRLVMTSILT